MSRSILDVVREICTTLPDVEEVTSHGSPNFKVRGKGFATYSLNHHGDGRVALWLRAPQGSQDHFTWENPKVYFVPPYVGRNGWLGVELNKTLSWNSIAARVHEAYCEAAPPALSEHVEKPGKIMPPSDKMKAEDINPFRRKRAQKILGKLDKLCRALPETDKVEQFGNPAWKAGKKTFLTANYYDNALGLQFWVGNDKQSLLTMDKRFSIPAYTGNNGWIALDIEDHADWKEIESLLMDSYRHFALKRMLTALA